MNNFSNSCEEKMSTVSSRITDLETLLKIFEAKLSSLPDTSISQSSSSSSSSSSSTGHVVLSHNQNREMENIEERERMGGGDEGVCVVVRDAERDCG